MQLTLYKFKWTPPNGQTKSAERGGASISYGLAKIQLCDSKTGCQMGNVKCLADADRDCRITRGVYQINCQNCQELTALPTEAQLGVPCTQDS